MWERTAPQSLPSAGLPSLSRALEAPGPATGPLHRLRPALEHFPQRAQGSLLRPCSAAFSMRPWTIHLKYPLPPSPTLTPTPTSRQSTHSGIHLCLSITSLSETGHVSGACPVHCGAPAPCTGSPRAGTQEARAGSHNSIMSGDHRCHCHVSTAFWTHARCQAVGTQGRYAQGPEPQGALPLLPSCPLR